MYFPLSSILRSLTSIKVNTSHSVTIPAMYIDLACDSCKNLQTSDRFNMSCSQNKNLFCMERGLSIRNVVRNENHRLIRNNLSD